MTDSVIDSYVLYFTSRVGTAKREARLLWWSGPVVLVALIGLGILLRSGPMVWAILALLYGLGFWGVRRLRSAAQVVGVACEHLRDVAKRSQGDATRETLLALLEDQVRPDDDSHVPEALMGLAVHPSSGGARAASHAAFARPSAELATASFVRTALVLGGLFGTVLFFAVELAGDAAQAGDLKPVLDGLRGALASTLTGILGSLVIGLFLSRLDRIVDETIWETEAFLNGPFSKAIARGESESIKTEPELWEGLREAVADLAHKTGETYDSLAGEVAAYSAGLGALGDRMANLPALKFPPQLSKLDTTVERFARGVESLGASSEALIAAVGTLGLFAPAKTLDELRRIAEASELQYKESASRLAEVARELGIATERIRDLTMAISQVPANLGERMDILEVATRQTASLVDEATSALRAGQQTALERMERLGEGQSQMGRLMQDIQVGFGESPELLSQSIAALQELQFIVSKSARELQGLSPKSSDEVQEMRRSNEGVNDRLKDLVQQSTELIERMQNIELASQVVQEHLNRLQSVTEKLGGLETVYAMCDRAERAPLLRLLLHSFGRHRDGSRAVGGNATPT